MSIPPAFRKEAAAHTAQRSTASTEPTSLKLGDVAVVFSLAGQCGPYIEGRGIIEMLCDRPHWYRIRFHGCHHAVARFISPIWQTDSERHLEALRGLWMASLAPPDPEEFFPPDI